MKKRWKIAFMIAEFIMFCAFPYSAIRYLRGQEEWLLTQDEYYLDDDDEIDKRAKIPKTSPTRVHKITKIPGDRCRVSFSGCEAKWRIDPESHWNRPWDGYLWMVIFDIPVVETTFRKQLLYRLKQHRMGWLQGSAWVSAKEVGQDLPQWLGIECGFRTFKVLKCSTTLEEAREIFREAFFHEGGVLELQKNYVEQIQRISKSKWSSRMDFVEHEIALWEKLMKLDPLLPACLHPPEYLGRESLEVRRNFYREMISHSQFKKHSVSRDVLCLLESHVGNQPAPSSSVPNSNA